MEKPPYSITPKILNLVSEIQQNIGQLKVESVARPSLRLRKENKIKTIHHSLAIEGNSLTEQQITAILEKKRVLGPQSQILEVQNALHVYDLLGQLNPLLEKDFLKAHQFLMKGLVKSAGKYRSTAIGILKGTKVSHVAPPAKQVTHLMSKLFQYLQTEKEIPWLVKACVFHYELEFIHPFEDGNGRMGRLWQQLLLMQQSSLFEFISTETLIHKKQKKYYQVLEKCDRSGDSTLFIEFSLEIILQALQTFNQSYRPSKPDAEERIQYALQNFASNYFTRKEYLQLHRGLSTATASRDLASAVRLKVLEKKGDQSQASYRFYRQK